MTSYHSRSRTQVARALLVAKISRLALRDRKSRLVSGHRLFFGVAVLKVALTTMPTSNNEHATPHLYGASFHGNERPGTYHLHETIIALDLTSKQRIERKESDDPCQCPCLPIRRPLLRESRVLYCRSISSSDLSESDRV